LPVLVSSCLVRRLPTGCLKVQYDRMHELLVKKDVLHADETTLQVFMKQVDLPDRPPTCGCIERE
jgi:hypothetical protein